MQDIQKHHQGFTFLELFVALAIFSAGLLGILQLQFLSARQMYEAVYISRAVQQAYNLSTLLLMFDANMNSSLAHQLEVDWNLYSAEILPEGEGRIEGLQIKVFWRGALDGEQSVLELQHGIFP